MKWTLILTLFIAALVLGSCEAPPAERKKNKGEKVAQKDHKHAAHEHEQRPDSSRSDPADGANAHMHQRSVEELIERFESEERDAYQKPEKVLDYLGDLDGKTVLDIGAGSGYFSVKMAKRGAQVIAADVNSEFQAYLSQRCVDENLENQIETRLIPFDSPELSPQEVDMVLIVNTYHHIKNRVDYFAQVKTGLKENGELVVVDFFKVKAPIGPPLNHKISMDVVIDELKKAGYESIQADVSLLPHQYIIRAH